MQFLIDILLLCVYIGLLLLVCAWAWRFWMLYIHQKFIDKVNHDSILLEIKLPREIFKSPLATETALSVFLQGSGVGDSYSRNWLGNLPLWASLEIASIEGVVHFFIRAHKKFRPLIESNFYAQYPGIEIVEADDYTKLIRYHHLNTDNVKCWGMSYKLTKTWTPKNEKTGEEYKKGEDKVKMPADFLPIKTYVDYGLDKDPKEEFKNDPIAPLIEFMGSVGKGEYVWYQILIQDQGNFDGSRLPKMFFNEGTGERMTLLEMAKAYKKQLLISPGKKKGDKVVDEYGSPKMKPSGKKDADGKDILEQITYQTDTVNAKKSTLELSLDETEIIKAIDTKLSKPLARVIIRMLYLVNAKKGSFNPSYIQNTLSTMKPYAGVNSFRPHMLTDPYDYPWQKWGGKRVNWRAEEKFEAYVEREGFHPHTTGGDEYKSLEMFEDRFFYPYSIKSRKVFRMIYEAIMSPFGHPEPEEVNILNLEELATLWHLPGQVVTTPTLPRIDSTKGVAPVNLPQ